MWIQVQNQTLINLNEICLITMVKSGVQIKFTSGQDLVYTTNTHGDAIKLYNQFADLLLDK